ncbi:JmjC domain,Zinc finger, RING/FYVE/PHD-type [Cinara cedri]|uniref:JmjC domain,Zinc finger, RING/FYVE/PHD-type n=1 Tax=Cinara cedri TaxID=506608 RepID=A0A5E4MTR3_9HEMI|nr:JmjC domain,Zinc finger, RING/FYVE/PHD-type [Cinara cedri]
MIPAYTIPYFSSFEHIKDHYGSLRTRFLNLSMSNDSSSASSTSIILSRLIFTIFHRRCQLVVRTDICRKFCNTGIQEKSCVGINTKFSLLSSIGYLKVAVSMSNIGKDQSADEIVPYQSTTGLFLQSIVCLHLPDQISKCIDCNIFKLFGHKTEEDFDENRCRFKYFRKLELKSENLTFAGYLNPFEDASKFDLNLWKTSQHSSTLNDLDINAAKRILEFIGGKFCKVIQDEKELLKFNWPEKPNIKTPIWRKPITEVRETCDVCKTAIFNYHWSCLTCGFVVCVYCIWYKITNYKIPNPDWLNCSNYEAHQLDELTITQILPGDSLEYVLAQMHEVCIKHKISLTCKCSGLLPKMSLSPINSDQFVVEIPKDMLDELTITQILPGDSLDDQFVVEIPKDMVLDNFHKDFHCKDKLFLQHQDDVNKNSYGIPYNHKEKSLFTLRPMVESTADYPPHSWLCRGYLLHLLDPDADANYKLFQEQWKRGQPVLVSGVSKRLDKSLWHPKSFLRDFGDQIVDLIDCNTNEVVHDQPMSTFWKGFKNYSKRLRDDKGHSMMLKLKDWPQSEDFADILPDRFNNLMDCLPLKEYTLRTGKFNLASYLPAFFNQPDLGPKMYIAYGNAGTTHDLIGTTNLHLDMSDAVNVMVYVAITDNCNEKSYEWYMNEAFNVINESGCDESSKNRVYENKLIPGAVWHIYHAKDADFIRDLLIRINLEENHLAEECSDPIHDQSNYLYKSHRDRLFREYGVRGYAIIQCVGEAVFIPAGAPHQVRNLHNCIKVAEDFVSPENISESFRMMQEFRFLSDSHTNHEDKLQLKNIVFHAVKESISVLTDTQKT